MTKIPTSLVRHSIININACIASVPLEQKELFCDKRVNEFTFLHFHSLLRLPCKWQPLPQNSGEQKNTLLYGVNDIYHKKFSVYGYSWFMLSRFYAEGCHLERLCNQALSGRSQTREDARVPTHDARLF